MTDLAASLAAMPEGAGVSAAHPWSSASDAALVDAVAAVLATPKRTSRPSSFVLHAPLELLARRALLAYAAPESRAVARLRIAEIAARYAREGEAVDTADAGAARGSVDAGDAESALLRALDEGLPDAAHAALDVLLATRGLRAVRASLFDAIAFRLGAAAHAPILLAELPRAVDRVRDAGALLRAPVRFLAAQADARLSWHRALTSEKSCSPDQASVVLWDRLAAPTRVSVGSGSLAPTMQAVEANGQAGALLADVLPALDPPRAERELLRIAAWSMLQDTLEEAPYGWTHCLTLPLGVLGNLDVSADPRACVAIAATYVLGMRASLGQARLDPARVPAPAKAASIFDVDPNIAASAAWHTPREERPRLVTELATRAAVHPDAHYAKYTLACLDVAERDRGASHLFLASAAWLGAYWAGRGNG